MTFASIHGRRGSAEANEDREEALMMLVTEYIASNQSQQSPGAREARWSYSVCTQSAVDMTRLPIVTISRKSIDLGLGRSGQLVGPRTWGTAMFPPKELETKAIKLNERSHGAGLYWLASS
jgi:hypothetical protein